MGFTLFTHFSGRHVMDSSFNIGKELLDCGMMDMKKFCFGHSDGTTGFSKVPCCSNEFVMYEIQDDFNTQVNQLNISSIIQKQ